jgi:hypothetical protein
VRRMGRPTKGADCWRSVDWGSFISMLSGSLG